MERLFIYGTLQPGGPNDHILAAIGGEWEPAVIKGTLTAAGWGASMGYPGLVIDERGDDVRGYVFASPHLSSQWAYLDDFEGEEYERILATVIPQRGAPVQAYVYVLRGSIALARLPKAPSHAEITADQQSDSQSCPHRTGDCYRNP